MAEDRIAEPASYPQPHEGIVGRDLAGSMLLSLDEQAQQHRDALIAMARHLRTATLVGDPAPVVKRMYGRITKPQVGNLVVEESRGMHARDRETRTKAFGILIAERKEWYETDAEWAEIRREQIDCYESEADADADRSKDHAWYVQYGPAPKDVCRWTNCSFLVLPLDPREFDYPAGFRDGNATVFTRGGLIGSLADAGMTLREASGD